MPKSKNIKKYIQNPASKVPGRAKVEGPGVWVTCVKGKEKQTIGELYDLFESIASELYPEDKSSKPAGADAEEDEDDEEEDLEKALAKELSELKKPRTETRFANCRTDVVCAVFISCRPPVDPVHLVMTHLRNVERTAVTQTRHALRFIPITDTCHAALPNIIRLAQRILPEGFNSDPGKPYKYKIQITTRNHSTVSRNDLIPALAQCVPNDVGHSVDLDHPELTILVDLYSNVCGMSVVRDFDELKKFNAVSIADVARKAIQAEVDKAEVDKVGAGKVEGEDTA